jgi:hypothetical protein
MLKCWFYVITFNSPNQVQDLNKSMLEYDPDFVKTTMDFINNSTDETTHLNMKVCKRIWY